MSILQVDHVEQLRDVPQLATFTDSSILRGQIAFLEAWRQLEWERAQITKGIVRMGCLTQVKRLNKEIARNKRFLARRVCRIRN